MIIGLFGVESDLKSRLRGYLINKSFYFCSYADLGRLEHDKNYVFDSSAPNGLQRAANEPKITLVWVGEDRRPSVEFDLVVSLDDPPEKAEDRLSQLVLRELSKQERPNWDEYFMKIAQVASTRGNCIKRKVGAVIVKDKRIISTGYNGTPRGTKNCYEGGCPRCNSLASSGTLLEECLCSHGEENAITQAAYHGTSVRGGTLYTTFAPCLMCSKMIINSGIAEVVFNADYPLNETAFNLFEQAEVRIRQYQLR